MSLSFPSNPTTNQQYVYNGTTYTYDGARWVSTTNTVTQSSMTVATANVAPSGAINGQMWLNSDTGTISVYALGGWVAVGSINPFGANTISTGMLIDNSVTPVKLINGAITTDKLADGAVTSSKIADNSITTTDIQDGAVTASKLAAGAAVPSQTGQSGKYLTTDGTTASWGTVTTISNVSIRAQAMTMGIIIGG